MMFVVITQPVFSSHNKLCDWIYQLSHLVSKLKYRVVIVVLPVFNMWLELQGSHPV